MSQIIAVYSVKVTVRQDAGEGVELLKAPKLDVIEEAVEKALNEKLGGLTANAEAERVD